MTSVPAQPHRPAVLVVDDEEQLRQYVSRVLEDEGYRTIGAGDGIEALRVLDESEGSIQLVITDVLMPNMDGLELAARLASRPHAPPVLFMSGIYSELNLTGPLLAKPFLPQDLSRMVRRLMSFQPGPLLVSSEH